MTNLELNKLIDNSLNIWAHTKQFELGLNYFVRMAFILICTSYTPIIYKIKINSLFILLTDVYQLLDCEKK